VFGWQSLFNRGFWPGLATTDFSALRRDKNINWPDIRNFGSAAHIRQRV